MRWLEERTPQKANIVGERAMQQVSYCLRAHGVGTRVILGALCCVTRERMQRSEALESMGVAWMAQARKLKTVETRQSRDADSSI
jgi:hypothetical protein